MYLCNNSRRKSVDSVSFTINVYYNSLVSNETVFIIFYFIFIIIIIYCILGRNIVRYIRPVVWYRRIVSLHAFIGHTRSLFQKLPRTRKRYSNRRQFVFHHAHAVPRGLSTCRLRS